jgi:gliding motility-associated lipoprotein GldD
MDKLFSVIIICLFIFSCDEVYTPKPKAYFRIDLPEKSYKKYNSELCPFQFEYPVYATVHQDTMFFDEKTENPCWLNIDFASLGGKIHISYKPITSEQTLNKLREDAHKLTFKHTIRADYIEESLINNKNGVSGMLYDVGGNAASNIQFYLTDSTQHYLRGALYFNTVPNADSISPVVKFVREDMVHFIETFSWK